MIRHTDSQIIDSQLGKLCTFHHRFSEIRQFPVFLETFLTHPDPIQTKISNIMIA